MPDLDNALIVPANSSLKRNGPEPRPGLYVVSVNYLAGITRSFWYRHGDQREQVQVGREARGYFCAPLSSAGRDRRYSLD